jgi:hypothetical protein
MSAELDDCGGFPSSPITIYKRLTDAIYSSNGNCPENEGRRDGNAMANGQMHCVP